VRKAWRSAAYGFAPVFATDPDVYLDGAHGADEALAVADLVEMTRFALHAIDALPRRAADG
jgi:acetylornithine deacetylase/succinyl-diaminopimelate desuccinylase-like protein